MDESKLLEQAAAYADNDDYPVTRNYLRWFIKLVNEKNERIAELERVNGDLVKCANCLGEVAREAFK